MDGEITRHNGRIIMGPWNAVNNIETSLDQECNANPRYRTRHHFVRIPVTRPSGARKFISVGSTCLGYASSTLSRSPSPRHSEIRQPQRGDYSLTRRQNTSETVTALAECSDYNPDKPSCKYCKFLKSQALNRDEIGVGSVRYCASILDYVMVTPRESRS